LSFTLPINSLFRPSDSLELIPHIAQPSGTSQPCPLTAKTGRVAALAYKNLEIVVNVYDEKGRKFDNISSLPLSWQVSNKDHGSLKLNKGVEYPKAK